MTQRSDIHKLLHLLKQEQTIYIQTHNFPDPDAVAAAFGLGHLLQTQGFECRLVYYGFIERAALSYMIRDLDIPIRPFFYYQIHQDDPVVIVDGCKGLRNVQELGGRDIGIIDHHEVKVPDDVPYIDIRSNYGATSSIIYEYYSALGILPPRNVATALMIGLRIDTANLSRAMTEEDYIAYNSLRKLADLDYVNHSIKNNIELADLDIFREALAQLRQYESRAFIWLPRGCPQNLLGILSDFFISVNEINLVVIAANNGDSINFSLRSDTTQWNAADIIRNALHGIGFGGGHSHMAGGLIEDSYWTQRATKENIFLLFEKSYPELMQPLTEEA